LTVAQIASEYGVHPTLLYQWREAALTALPTVFSDQSAKEAAAKEAAYQQQIDQLYREVGKLTTQLNWLKKKLDISLTICQRKEMVVLVNEASSTSHTPSGKLGLRWVVTSIARRVLPAPPVPVMVKRRVWPSRASTSDISLNCPMKLVSGLGRLPGGGAV
jgi:transposase-like protein